MNNQRSGNESCSRVKSRILPRLEELESRIAPVNDLFVVPGAVGSSTPVRIDWMLERTLQNNELGIYTVDDAAGTVGGLSPGAPGYAFAALARTQAILPQGSGEGFHLDLTLGGGTLLGLYLVPDGTTLEGMSGAKPVFFSFDAANPDGIDHILPRLRADGGMDFLFEDVVGGGDLDFDDAIVSLGVTRALVSPGQVGQTVQAQFNLIASDTPLDTEMGVVVLDDASGSVGGVLPGDPRYAAVAIANGQSIFTNGIPNASNTLTLPGGRFFGFYLIANGTGADFLARNPTNTPGTSPTSLPLAYFLFPEANPDGRDHTPFSNPNVIFWEDLFGGDRDFNDMVVSYTLGIPQGVVPGTPPNGTPPDIPPDIPDDPDDTTPPTVNTSLVNDTGSSNTDRITNDPTIQVGLVDENTIVSVRAGFDDQTPANFTDILDQLDTTTNNITIDENLAAQINGAPLADGQRNLNLEVTNSVGNVAMTNFTFTLDTVAPVLDYNLANTDDTGVVGDLRTDRVTVGLTGTTEAGSTVVLLTTNTTTQSTDGTFTFDGISLSTGPNNFSVRATDLAGNATLLNRVITRNQAPVVSMTPADQNLLSTDPPQDIALDAIFSDAEEFVRFDTVLGDIDVHLFDSTPQTRTNFLNYVQDNDYTNAIFHRLVPGFVLQGGGFQFASGNNPQIIDIPADPPVVNEPGVTNAQGTIAMAKLGGDPNSATNEFFFNLDDNSQNLDNQNGGFTAFGQIASGGQAVLNQFEALPISNQSAFNSALGSLPLQPGADTTNFPANINANDLALINTVTVLPNNGLVFSVDNPSPSVLSANITGSTLTITPMSGQSGSVDLTLRATDRDGSVAETTLRVNVGTV